MQIQGNIKTLFRRRIGARFVIVCISVLFSIAFYSYIMDFYSPNRNIFDWFHVEPAKYSFYSGGEGGYYEVIGSTLDEVLATNDVITIQNKKTAGGSENAIKVLTTPKSFGLVQEETLRKDDMIREKLNYVIPLYMERMHVVYRKDPSNPDFVPRISTFMDEESLDFFSKSNISIGPVGSGTRVLSSFVMNEINNQIGDRSNAFRNSQFVKNSKMVEAFESFESNDPERIDIVFVMAGSPLSIVTDLLDSDSYGLISISPSFVSNLNKQYNLNLRMSDFSEKYNTKPISTFGSFSYLIASPDVSSDHIHYLLESLHNNNRKVKAAMNIKNDAASFALDEFDYMSDYTAKSSELKMNFLKDIILFVLSFGLSLVLATSFLLWLVSSLKQSKHFRELHVIIEDNIPRNNEFIDQDGARKVYKTPLIKISQTEIINKVIEGIKKINDLQSKVSNDYRTGGISDNHFDFLQENMDEVKKKLRKSLFLRLNEAIESSHPSQINREFLRKLLTADYLLIEDYERLSKLNIS